MTILDEIVAKTKIRVEKLKTETNINNLKIKADSIPGTDFAFEKALKKSDISFICEIKKASPSKGIIAKDFPYLEIAKEYEEAGADAISVLTEPDFFMGCTKYLQEISQIVKIPIIRKDFIIDEIQIYESKVIGANAILLICSILNETELRNFIEIADFLGLSCLVEVHNENEIQKAIKANARIIGVNNRNLKDFTVNIRNSINLRRSVPDNILFVSESGIKTNQQIQELRQNKADAVLIGETFMRCKNKKYELENLKGKRNEN